MIQEVVPKLNNNLRKRLTKQGVPYLVPVEPFPNCEYSDCWLNVTSLIEKHGGKRITGRIVWAESHGKWLHLEAHCNWKRPDGTLIDPTPKEDGESEIVFVEEHLEFQGYEIPSKFICCDDNPLVSKLVQVLQRQAQIRSLLKSGETNVCFQEVFDLELQKQMLQQRIYRRPAKSESLKQRNKKRRTKKSNL